MSEKIEKKIETAKSFERQLYAENERSKKNAWRVVDWPPESPDNQYHLFK